MRFLLFSLFGLCIGSNASSQEIRRVKESLHKFCVHSLID